jgi:hypothetical protein
LTVDLHWIVGAPFHNPCTRDALSRESHLMLPVNDRHICLNCGCP